MESNQPLILIKGVETTKEHPWREVDSIYIDKVKCET